MPKLKVYVAGHEGMVGSAIIRMLKKNKNIRLITKNKKELNLINQEQVQNFFYKEKPDQVYIAAAKVGGIYANSIYPAEFIYENLMVQSNIINAAFVNEVKKLLFLGSSCIYPKFTVQPIKEEYLLSGLLEQTNEAYAVAKIAGVKMCESYNRQYGISHNIDYRCVMPTNLYGPGDNYHLNNSHVIPALIRKFHEAKINNQSKVIVWGTGKVRREFLHVDDLAGACIYIMNLERNIFYKAIKPSCSHINVGSGEEFTIAELAKIIKEIVGYIGEIEFDLEKPDGMKRKFLDSKNINNLGWKKEVSLRTGLRQVYKDFKSKYKKN
jgi:GDP-L-fucose synthase